MAKPKNNEPKLQPISVTAYPEEIERWTARAKADHRPLSQWLRVRLLEADSRDEELATLRSELKDGRTSQ